MPCSATFARGRTVRRRPGGQGPKDPLDRPFAGRRLSAVEQGYRYAINCLAIGSSSPPSARPDSTTKEPTSRLTNGSNGRTCRKRGPAETVRLPPGAARVVPGVGPLPFPRPAGRIGAGGQGPDKGVLPPNTPRCGRTRSSGYAATTRTCHDRTCWPAHRSCSTGCCSGLLRRPRPAAHRHYPQGLRAPRPVPSATDLGELSRDVRAPSTAATRPWGSRLQRRAVCRRSGLDDLKVPTRFCAYFRELGNTIIGRRSPGGGLRPGERQQQPDRRGHPRPHF